MAKARKLPRPVTSLTTPLPCSARSNAVPVCGATLSRAASALGVSAGARSSASSASGSRERLSHAGHDPPALLGGRFQPVEFAQPHPRAFGHEVEEGERPGDRAAAAGDAVGGVAAQAGQRVARGKPHGRIGGPDRQEDAARRSLRRRTGRWRRAARGAGRGAR